MEVYEFDGKPLILCGSGNDWGGEGGYIPNLPGQTDDMNHLA